MTVDEFEKEVAEKRAACPHMNFMVRAEVNRITSDEAKPEVITAFNCDLRVFCNDCGKPFQFVGLPNGFSFYQPTVSLDAETAHFPLVHEGFSTAPGMPGYSVNITEVPKQRGDVQ